MAGEGVRAEPVKKSDLGPRVISAIVMAGVALLTAWWGGWPFKILWFLLAGFVLREWLSILTPDERIDSVSKAAPYLVLMASFFGPLSILLLTDNQVSGRIVIGALAISLLASIAFVVLKGWKHAKWAIGGCLYATILFVSVSLLRLSDSHGMAVILFLFAVVWGADVGAYFAGRAIGGPKLAPRISPNKTWSGFCGGIAAGVLLSLLLLAALGVAVRPMHALIAALLALASVAGDLFESFFKRKFGVKDSGHIIPGHGGFMDRLDGFIFAAALAALIGLMRGGVDTTGGGLIAGW